MPKANRLSPGAVKLLQEPQLAHFVTLMSDGEPQITPVWVDVEADGSMVLVNTVDGRVKDRNVEQDNRVALSVVDKNDPWRYALIRGTVVERTKEGAEAHIDALAKKYLGKDVYPNRQPGMERIILKIRPHHILERGTEGS